MERLFVLVSIIIGLLILIILKALIRKEKWLYYPEKSKNYTPLLCNHVIRKKHGEFGVTIFWIITIISILFTEILIVFFNSTEL